MQLLSMPFSEGYVKKKNFSEIPDLKFILTFLQVSRGNLL